MTNPYDTYYHYVVHATIPELGWDKWKKCGKMTRDMFEFAAFVGGDDVNLSIVSGSPFAFVIEFDDKRKRLEWYRSAFIFAFPGVTFKNWSVNRVDGT